MPELGQWAILIAKSNAEIVAERALRQAGLRTYLPWYRKLIEPHGRERQSALVMRLVFPGIIFVQAWPGFYRPLTGVDKAMPSYRGGPPATMNDSDIDILMRREREGAFDEAKPPRGFRADQLTIGSRYRIDMFETSIGAVLEELSPNGQALVRIMIFGRETIAQVDAYALRDVAHTKA